MNRATGSQIDDTPGTSLSDTHKKCDITMKFTVDKQEKYTILRLDEPSINSILAPSLKSEFVFLSSEGNNNLILDLSSVTFIDSSGLSSILVADRIWKELGTFILTGIVHESVKKLIGITRLDSTLTIIPTLPEAIDYVFMEELHREITGGGEIIEDDGSDD